MDGIGASGSSFITFYLVTLEYHLGMVQAFFFSNV